MRFCTDLLNFVRNRKSATELWRHIDVTRWRPWRRKSTSGFWFDHLWHVGRSKAISIQISTRYLNVLPRYYYFRFLKTNGRRIEIILPVSILTFSLSSYVILQWPIQFCANMMNADEVMTSLILQDGGHSVANLLPDRKRFYCFLRLTECLSWTGN